MSKRRNLKKEKASRNQAYARQFRKKQTGGFGRNRYSNNQNDNRNKDDKDTEDEKETERN